MAAYGATAAVVLTGVLLAVSLSHPMDVPKSRSGRDLDSAVGVPRSRTKRDLFSLSGVIRCVTGNSALLMYNNYGCFCGRGGTGGRPVDDIDRCCVAHDSCYALPTWFNALFVIYPYRCAENNVTCTSRNWLRRSVCECDRALAECFARSEYNPRYKNYPHCGALQPEDPAVHAGMDPAVHAGKDSDVHAGKDPEVHAGKDPAVHAGKDPAVHAGKDPEVHAGNDPAVQAGKDPAVQAGKDDTPGVGSGDGYDRFLSK